MSVTQASLLGDSFGSRATGTIPVGGIIMWSGSIVSIPTGWALCNGSNGTPNLLDRFIVGAGSGYAVAGTGGSADATLVSHSHTATSTVSDPGHGHSIRASGGTNTGNLTVRRTSAEEGCQLRGDGEPYVCTNTTGITVGTTISTEGASATDANLPPYYALAFIMRTS